MIKFTRQSAWCGRIAKMQININDEMSLSLSNGETKDVDLPTHTKNITISVFMVGKNQGEFTTKYSSNLKEIVIKQESFNARCFIVLRDGTKCELIGKNIPNNANRAIYWILLITFVVVLGFLIDSTIIDFINTYIDTFMY